MTAAQRRWAGVDVGAGKGFDLAVIAGDRLVGGPVRIVGVPEAARWLRDQGPRVVAVDAPRSAAADGELSRPEERDLVKAKVCGIRYTPSRAALDAGGSYYAWIRSGLELYRALSEADGSPGWALIECFPTATWSRLGGPRGEWSRTRWTHEVLSGLGLSGLPRRMSQDARDAIGAAVTARLYDEGRTESFGDIVVPVGDGPALSV